MNWHKVALVNTLSIALVVSALPHAAWGASCTNTSSCTAALKNLEQQLQQNQKKLNTTQATVSTYKSSLQDLSSTIQTTESKINQTKDQIDDTKSKVEELSRSISYNNSHLERLHAQMQQQLVEMYQQSQRSTVEIILSSQSFGEAVSDLNYLQTLEEGIQNKAKEVKDTQDQLNSQKDELQQKQSSLVDLNDSLDSRKKNLAGQMEQTNFLLSATNSQLRSYVADQQAIKKSIAETQRKLQQLINEAHWGDDIASAPTATWSYNQLNYGETLGRSPYTIHDYGCFVTSLAMVASFYGHRTTPPQVASHNSDFTRSGYAITGALAASIGLSIKDHGSVNWATVDDELKSGHPVIVSIYLPQVGAINSDGSSHFIVLQGKKGNQYQMQDPLGAGRSYALKYVRSMYLLKG